MRNFAVAGFALMSFVAAERVQAQDSDVIVATYNILEKQERISFIQKTAKEMNTPEGKLIFGAVASYLGIDSKLVAAAVNKLAPQATQNRKGEDYTGFFRTPVGYTICYARPTNPNMGSGQFGIETHNSTYNTTIYRAYNDKKDDGLGFYMNLPKSVNKDSRVHAPFEIVFVKTRNEKCQPNGSHPWLATKNRTTLNVPCRANIEVCPPPEKQ